MLKDLLSPDRVATINKAYATQFGELTHQSAAAYIKEVGDQRLMVALEVAGAFSAPDIFANPVVLSIVDQLLGGDFILGSYVAVTSMAGAKAQRLHTDQQGLFDDPVLDSAVPAYSVTLIIPLIGLNPTTGSTQFFSGKPPQPGEWQSNRRGRNRARYRPRRPHPVRQPGHPWRHGQPVEGATPYPVLHLSPGMVPRRLKFPRNAADDRRSGRPRRHGGRAP